MIELSWAFLGSVITVIVGWVISFFKIRKDERIIQIENITKERKEWRIYVRKWLEKLSASDIQTLSNEKKIQIRSQLISRINLKDRYDLGILESLDKILELEDCDQGLMIDLKKDLQIKISLLLKHDWERVKNETNPFYKKGKTEEELLEIRDFYEILTKNKTIPDDLSKTNNNISNDNFDTEMTKELCTQVTLFPLFASVIIIFHIVEKNYQFNFDEKFFHWLFIFILNFVFAVLFSGILDRKDSKYWLKFNVYLILILGVILFSSLLILNDLNLRGLDASFIIMTSIVASVYTVVAFRSLNTFFKKLTNYRHRLFAVGMIVAIEFFIIITAFSL
ncbi:hypothetical protein [Acinetobacter venetianus]|uniref:hypothetical protein n=2 Tax=Acinetobacter venetianus TaxID=52133 RepID=UPI00384C8B12